MALERTLALIKPDCCSRPWIEEYLRRAPVPEGEEAPEDAPPSFELVPEERARDKADAILARIAKEGFTVLHRKMVHLSKAEAESFYAEHAGRPFFERLTAFMSSGPTLALVLEREDAVAAWRALMGPTNSLAAKEQADAAHPLDEEQWGVRATWGTDGTRNAAHGSDSYYSAWREIGFFFPELEPEAWERSVAVVLPHAVAAGRADAVAAAVEGADLAVAARARAAALPAGLVAALLGRGATGGTPVALSGGECELLLVEGRGAVRKLRLLAGPPPSVAAGSAAPSLHRDFGVDDAQCGVVAAPSPAAVDEALPLFPSPLPVELTLCVVKPGAADTHYRAILEEVVAAGFTVVAEVRRRLSREDVEAFYAEHKGRPFFPGLCDYMSSGPVVALALSKPGAIRAWRLLQGPTNTAVAARDKPASLRARFGVDGTRNATHGSDSPAAAARELRFYFPTLPLNVPGGTEGGKAAVEYITNTVVAEVFDTTKGFLVSKTLNDVIVEALSELAKTKPATRATDAVRWLGQWLVENNPRRGVVAQKAPTVEEPEDDAAAAAAIARVRSRALARGAPRAAGGGGGGGGGGGASAPTGHAPPKRTVVFVLGAPGSGKGTQCARLSAEFGYTHLSAGALLRAEVASGSPLGAELQAVMARGELVSTAMVVKMLAGAMEASGGHKFLLSGFPRAVDQAVQFEKAFGAPAFVLAFSADDATLRSRLGARGAGEGGRAEDTSEESVRARLATYHAETEPVAAFYQRLGLLRSVDSLRPVEAVYREARRHFQPQHVWLLGGPGAGRSTSSVAIAGAGWGWHHISTGELLRAEVASGSALGKEIQLCLDRGDPVGGDVALRMVTDAIARIDPVGRFLLDGCVLDKEQAVAFEGALGAPQFVLNLVAPDATLLARAAGARKGGKRADSHIAVLKNQLATYHAATEPLVALYAARGLVRTVDANRAPSDVLASVRRSFSPRVAFFLGGPGSGKGTHCARVAAEFGYTHLSTGDLLRAEVERGTPDGAAVAALLADAKIVPAALTLALLKKAIVDSRSWRVVVAGYPRAVEQATAFAEAVCEPEVVLNLECPAEEMRARLTAKAGPADNAVTIGKRLATYADSADPVLAHYARAGIVRAVDAAAGLEEVYASVREAFRARAVPVLGLPGSGKGTQCARLAAEFGYAHLCAGDLLRAEVEAGSPIGGDVKAVMEAGALVDDATMVALIEGALAAASLGGGGSSGRVLLDGFPRTPAQAAALEARHGAPALVLSVDVPRDAARARVAGADAKAHPARSEEDTAAALAKLDARLDAAAASDAPLHRAYHSARLLRAVSGLGSSDAVYARARRFFQPRIVVLVRDAGCLGEELAARAGRELGYCTLDVEALLAAETRREGSAAGKAIAAAAAARRTPPMDATLGVVAAAMAAARGAQRFILDGFPRVVSAGFPAAHDQVMAAEERLGAIKGALVVNASLEVRAARLGAKSAGEVAVVRAKGDSFRRERAPVASFFERLGKACVMDSSALGVDELFEAARPFLE
jgi:adenylate kinase